MGVLLYLGQSAQAQRENNLENYAGLRGVFNRMTFSGDTESLFWLNMVAEWEREHCPSQRATL